MGARPPNGVGDEAEMVGTHETGTFGPTPGGRNLDGCDRSPWYAERGCSKIEVWVSSLHGNYSRVPGPGRPVAPPGLGPTAVPREAPRPADPEVSEET